MREARTMTLLAFCVAVIVFWGACGWFIACVQDRLDRERDE
jgi:hypothetical protein